MDFNNNLKWLTFDEIRSYLQPMIENINNNINEEKLKKKLDELMEIEYEENIKNTEEIELENKISDVKENIDSDNSSDNIIDTI